MPPRDSRNRGWALCHLPPPRAANPLTPATTPATNHKHTCACVRSHSNQRSLPELTCSKSVPSAPSISAPKASAKAASSPSHSSSPSSSLSAPARVATAAAAPVRGPGAGGEVKGVPAPESPAPEMAALAA